MALTKPQRIALLLVLTAIIGVSLVVLSSRALVPGMPDQVAFRPAPDQPRPILIHVDGAVAQPGLYWVAEGTRVYQVLQRAGGVHGDADTSALSMAAVVHDGERVFVPTKAAPPAWQPPAGVDTGNVGVLPTRPERGGTAPRTRQERRPTLQGPINVNTATAEDLARLPQIGPSLAQRIVEYRTAHGPFRALQDLDAVPGLGPKTLQAIAPFVSF